MKKAILFTVFTFWMLSIILILASYFFLINSRSIDVTYDKARIVSDDVKTDIETIIGLNVSIDANKSRDTNITFTDHINATKNIKKAMKDYKTFIEGYYQNETSTELSLNITTFSSQPSFNITPYNFSYGYNKNFKKDEILIYPGSKPGNLRKYEIELKVNVDENYINSTDSTEAGSLYINITVMNKSGSVVNSSSAGIRRDKESNWTFNFTGRLVYVYAGNISRHVTGKGNDSILITSNNVKNISTKIKMTFEATNEIIGVDSNIKLSMERPIEKKESTIWLARS